MPRRATTRHWVAVLLAWVGVSGCDFVSTPDRFIDDTVQPPVVAAVDYTTIRSGQHLAGTVSLTADLDSIASPVDYVALMVNGEQIDSAYEAPYTLTLPTDRYPDGPATIGLAIFKRGGNQGLYGYVGAPATTLVTPVVFDQRPPSQVEELSGDWTEDGAELTWTPNRDPNFYAYLIIREDTWSNASDGGSAFGFNAVVLDTLYDASAAVYRDAASPPVYGLTSTYRVAVSNRVVAIPSGEVALSYGTGASIPSNFVYSSVYHPTRDLAYRVDQATLSVWNPSDGTTLATVDLSSFIQAPELAHTGYISAIRKDGTELYIYASDPASLVETSELLVFSATEKPSFLRRLSAFPNDAYGVRPGPDGFLIAASGSALRVYDAADGQLQSTLTGAVIGATVNRAGATILTQRLDDTTGTCVLTSYDPATGDSVNQTTYPFDGMACWNVYVMNGGSTIYLVSVMDSRFRRVDGASFDITAPIDFPVAPGELVDRVSVSGDRLFLGVRSFASSYQNGAVLEVEADGQTVARTWRFAPSIERIFPSADGAAFYALSTGFPSSRIWRVSREN
jgi:hypothetical protein